jgi:hypothetical protein
MKPKGSQFSLNPDAMGKPTQLPMFMPASDLRDSITATADMPNYSVDEVMDIKLTDSMRMRQEGQHGSGVYSSVEKQGVLNPVQLIHGDNDIMLGQGHHRAAAADFESSLSKRPQWLPVVHTDARSGTKILDQDDTGEGLKSPGARRAAIGDMTEYEKNTGTYYRGWQG